MGGKFTICFKIISKIENCHIKSLKTLSLLRVVNHSALHFLPDALTIFTLIHLHQMNKRHRTTLNFSTCTMAAT